MVKLTQNSWLGGQMDVRMGGRQDMANYRNGASVLKNFLPVKLGSIRKRPGTDLVCDLTDFIYDADSGRDPASTKFRMIPYGFLSGEGFVLVIVSDIVPDGQQPHCAARAYRFHADGSWRHYIQVTGDMSYAADELDEIGYVQCGDILYLAHQNHHPAEIRHDLDGTTHSFEFSDVVFNPVDVKPECGWMEGKTEIRVSYTRAYFEDFSFTREDQDIMNACTAHLNPPEWVRGNPWYDAYYSAYSRKKYNGKTVVNYRASVVINGMEGPLSDLDESVDVKNRFCSISFASPWTESQVAKIPVRVTIPATVSGRETKNWEIRLYKENGGVYGLVGTFGGTTTGLVTHDFTDDNIAPDTSVTPIDDSDGTPFAEDGDYPGSVGLYQQRLVWAGSRNDPARIWMSRAGDLYEYRPHDKLQLDDAIDFILPITQFAKINFIVELGRLFAFTECTELVIGSNSDSAGVSYETIMASEHSHLGCTKRLPPIVANNTLLFVNRTGQSVRDYDTRIESGRFGGTDVSVFSTSVFADNPIVDWTWQQEPNSTVWCVLADGRLASFTYDKEQRIAAWAVHELGGGGKAQGIAKTCAVFGHEAGRPTTGEVMVAVERGGRLTLERMRPWGAANDKAADRLCMDATENVIAAEIEDEAFAEWAHYSCKYLGESFALADGRMAVFITESNIKDMRHFAVGYPFESVMTTMPPVIGDNVGQAQFDVKLGQHAHLRTVGSRGGEIYAVGMGDQASPIDEGAVRDGEDEAGFRDVDVVLAGNNNRDGRVTVRHDGMGPFQLTLLELDYESEA